MEYEELMKSTLIDLRSVTQSCKGGVPLNNLQNDYKKLIGKPIPFNSLGFNSLVEFIQSIPDVIKLNRNSNGVLFAEAVFDSSTSHLANMISKQKGPSSRKVPKSSYVSKKYGFHKQNNASKLKSLASSSSNSITSEESSVKDQEIENLKSNLDKEKKINKELSSQMIRLNSLVKIGQDSIAAEPGLVKQLKSQLQASQVNSVVAANETPPSNIQSSEDLKSKLEVAENKNSSLSSEVTKLNSLVQIGQEKLSAEQKRVQQLQSQLEDLQKKMLLKCSALNEVKWDENLGVQKNAESLSWNDNLLKTNLPKSMKSLQAADQNSLNSQLDFVSMHKEQCIQVNDLKNQVKQQHEHMTTLRKELKQQQLQICNLTFQVEKLSSGPPKIEVDMDLVLQMMKHLEQSSQNRQLLSDASALSNNSIKRSVKNHLSVDQQCMKLSQPVQVISEKPHVSVKNDSALSTSKKSKKKKKNANIVDCTSITSAIRDNSVKS